MSPWLFIIYQKVSEIPPGWNVNGMAILVFPTEEFQIFRNVLKDTPKFANGNVFTICDFHQFQAPLQIGCVTCHSIGVVQMVHADPDRNFSLRIFAYHLYEPSTNRFSHVNGKQPQAPRMFRNVWKIYIKSQLGSCKSVVKVLEKCCWILRGSGQEEKL